MYIIQDVNALFPVLSDFRAKNEKSAQNVRTTYAKNFSIRPQKEAFLLLRLNSRSIFGSDTHRHIVISVSNEYNIEPKPE